MDIWTLGTLLCEAATQGEAELDIGPGMDAELAKLWARYLKRRTIVRRNELAARHMGLAVGAAKIWAGRTGLDVDELMQEASIALVEAVQTWRPHNGTRFESWAYGCIRNRMIQYVTHRRRNKNKPMARLIRYDTRGKHGNDGEGAPDGRSGVDAARAEDAELLAWLVGLMPMHLRPVARLTFLDGLEGGQVAELIGCHRFTVVCRLRKVRALMRRAAREAGLCSPHGGLLRGGRGGRR